MLKLDGMFNQIKLSIKNKEKVLKKNNERL